MGMIVHHTQDGFVRNRNFLNNVVDIDSSGRLYSIMYEDRFADRDISHIPISGAFDFEATFPSVIHLWVWLLLMHRKLPEDYLFVFKGLYKDANATFKHQGVTHILIRFLSGVLQGCPASAFLFNNALDPFPFWTKN